MHREQVLTILFRFGTLSTQFAIGGIEAALIRHNIATAGFALDSGEQASLSAASARLLRRRETTFHLTGQGFVFDLSLLRKCALDFLEIRFPDSSPVRPDDWIEPFAADSNFVVAWWADAEYDHWQNAYDLLQYTSAGKSFAHLPMKSNCLPYPLEQTIIDTSSNPGRGVLRSGYIEAVGAIMWLGDTFWRLTEADSNQITQSSYLRVSNPLEGITRVEAAEEPFVTTEGESGKIQRLLRALLFPRASYQP